MLIEDRVKLIIKANGLTASEFADQIGLKRSNLSHVLNGRNKPGLDFLSKVINAFPNVNASWLITGVQRNEPEVEKKTEVKKLVEPSVEAAAINTKSTEIEKIVVFYVNGSFKEYTPSAE